MIGVAFSTSPEIGKTRSRPRWMSAVAVAPARPWAPACTPDGRGWRRVVAADVAKGGGRVVIGSESRISRAGRPQREKMTVRALRPDARGSGPSYRGR